MDGFVAVNDRVCSFERVSPRAQTALAESPIFELRRVSVHNSDNALILEGRVSSFYHKQLAQELVRAVCRDLGCDAEVVEVVNAIQVR